MENLRDVCYEIIMLDWALNNMIPVNVEIYLCKIYIIWIFPWRIIYIKHTFEFVSKLCQYCNNNNHDRSRFVVLIKLVRNDKISRCSDVREKLQRSRKLQLDCWFNYTRGEVAGNSNVKITSQQSSTGCDGASLAAAELRSTPKFSFRISPKERGKFDDESSPRLWNGHFLIAFPTVESKRFNVNGPGRSAPCLHEKSQPRCVRWEHLPRLRQTTVKCPTPNQCPNFIERTAFKSLTLKLDPEGTLSHDRASGEKNLETRSSP